MIVSVISEKKFIQKILDFLGHTEILTIIKQIYFLTPNNFNFSEVCYNVSVSATTVPSAGCHVELQNTLLPRYWN